jgi:aerobic carbon-monoxide dehydrogenase small subunit
MDVTLTVNGVAQAADVEPRTSLADLLRDKLGLTGTTLGCEHGVCGSCTVLVDGTAVRACLMLAVQCTGRDVKTVEGLAEDGRLHPLQEAFAAEHALQCGFCTPGFLMLLAGALAAEPDLDSDERRLDEVLASNLCRCTGYVNIRRAAVRAAKQLRHIDAIDQR